MENYPGQEPEQNMAEKEGSRYEIARAVGKTLGISAAVGTAAYGLAYLFASLLAELAETSRKGAKAVGISAAIGTAAYGLGSLIASRLEETPETSRKDAKALELHGNLSAPKKERWQPPEYPWYKLNTDGTRQPDLGFSGAGGLIRDYSGKYHVGFSVKLELCDPSEAEWWGAYRGLSLAWNSGFKRIILEIDNEGVANKINEIIERRVRNYVDTPKGRIQRLLGNVWEEVKVISIPREANKCAHRLADMAVEKNMSLQPLVMEQPPDDQNFQEFLLQDSNDVLRLK